MPSNPLMKFTRLGSWALVAGLLLGACDSKDATSSEDVDKAAAIAREVKASPDDAEAILKKHGMSEDEFEALMYEIAEDPKKSEAFASKVGR